MDSHTNQKVYVNPNFNRTGTHLNKHFPHQAFNNKQNFQGKIYINPNFVTLHMNEKNLQHIRQMNMKQNITKPQNFVEYNEQKIIWNVEQNKNDWDKLGLEDNLKTSSRQLINNNAKVIDAIHTNKCDFDKNQVTITPLVKSRYCLVNSFPKPQTANANAVKAQGQSEKSLNPVTNTYKCKGPTKSRYRLVRNSLMDSPKIKSLNKNCTIKISKYKMVTFNNLKATLQSPKASALIKTLPIIKANLVSPKSPRSPIPATSSSVIRNKFKFTKYNGRYNRSLSLETKEISKSNAQFKTKYQTKKILKRNFKINNVPCPLYSKYGKCLRQAKGNCEYLHDKKHISLCRRFLKGICHDNNCLLSHELSDKKMPTCYFYLKGMCTKEQCPYLHIKLNEKAKLCQDFLKGYCERGENCLLRHVKKQYSSKNVSSSLNKSFRQTPNLMRRLKCDKPIDKNFSTFKNIISEGMNDKKCEPDHRYYRDVVSEDTEKCEIIKPMRCKLGTLPSFIQL